MKILMLLTDGFGGQGGIAKFNRDFLTALSSHPECENIIVLPRHFSRASEEIPDNVIHATAADNSKINYVMAFLTAIFKQKKMDIVVCGHIHLLPLAYLAKVIYKIPLVLIVHGIDAWSSPRSVFVRQRVRKIDALISVSKFSKDRFLSWAKIGDIQTFILPNCISMRSYGMQEKKQHLLNRYGLQNRKVLLTLGRMQSDERYKGFDEVMEVLPEIAKIIPNISYVIAGAGSDRNRLEEKSRHLGIASRVVFTGFISEEEKADHLRLADAFVMPGRGEGFGIVYLEAMACGIPVVASKLDGSREAVREGTLGIMVDPDNPDELKSGIVSALSRQRIIPWELEFFSLENFNLRLHQIIDQLIQKKK